MAESEKRPNLGLGVRCFRLGYCVSVLGGSLRQALADIEERSSLLAARRSDISPGGEPCPLLGVLRKPRQHDVGAGQVSTRR